MPAITRRTALQLGASGFLTLTAFLPLLGCEKPGTHVAEELDWQRFVDQINQIARTQHEKSWDQAQYLTKVRDILLGCRISDDHVQKIIQNYKNAHRNFPEIRDMHRTTEVQVCLLEFEPNERIALHDHPDMTGCIRCIEGEVRICNFTEIGPGDKANHIKLTLDSDVTMVPGSTGALTSTTANLHDLHAKKFTRLIDVFTPPYNKDRSKRSRWFDLNSQVVAGKKDYIATVKK